MKKIIALFAFAAILLVSCNTKENPESVIEEPVTSTITLQATFPSFTKASVDDSGIFSWTENDEISVVYTDGSNEQNLIFKCTDAANGTFVFNGEVPAGYTLKTDGSIAFYPSDYNGTPSLQDFSSPEAAAKRFQMHATNDNGVLKFQHDNALLKVTVNNVPSFAQTLSVGGVNVQLNQTENSNLEVFIPVIPAAASKLKIEISDGTNAIISKTTANAVAISVATLYPLPGLSVGPVLLIKNNVLEEMDKQDNSWASISSTNGEICFYSSYGNTEYVSWSASVSNLNEVTIDGITYGYFVYPASATGNSVYVEICNKDEDGGFPKASRNVTLTDGETFYNFGYGMGLKAADEHFCYAYYQNGGSESINIYAYNPVAFGDWDNAQYSTGRTIMWSGGFTIRYYLLNGFNASSNFIIRNGETTDKLIGDDLPTSEDVNYGRTLNFFDGDCVIAYWKNGNDYWWFSPSNLEEYLQDVY